MKAAIAAWDDRIAPVFDVTRMILLVEIGADGAVTETRVPLEDELPAQKALRLGQLGVGLLVCGAISRPLQGMIEAIGIEVVPFVAGDLRDIITAWRDGHLADDRFAMPGCCGRGGRRRVGRVGQHLEGTSMRGRFRGGAGGGSGGRGAGGGRGGGRGQGGGQGGWGAGRMGGPVSAGPDGWCLCPGCGHRQPHERGVPCNQVTCSQCGGPMIRDAAQSTQKEE
jgi:predicted Fe-Mo cluster-binding NifX family protein